MNEALISGLLGAIMGGSSSIEKSIAEEEAAKRKEEEEKRREERALTIAERKIEMEAAKKQRLEEQERAKIAKTAPAKAPDVGIVGNAIDEYQGEIANTGYTGQTRQATPEEALRWSINKAREEGREDLAKQREEALYKMLKEGRESAKEAREQQEFARGKPEKATEATRSFEANVLAAYTGPKDAEGKPLDPEDFGKFRARAANARLFGRERPEGAGGEKPPRAITPKEETAARNSLQRDLARLSEVTDAKGKVARDPLMWESLNKITSRIIKEDRTKLLDPGLADEARAEVQAAIERARTDIRADLEKKTDAKGEPLSREQMRKNEAILKNQYSLDRYTKENLPKYVNRYLGGGAAEEPKRGGRPWERSWGSME